jgi:asparagine synthase (glutamine-hydrolysing)
MCGINGIAGFNDLSKALVGVKLMNQAVSHRGPDDEGIFSEEKIILGHRRLSIIDLSSAGHQPMQSGDERFVITYNGELYNYKELKLELQRSAIGSHYQSYLFKTNSDTEVILAAYSRWGKD